MAGSLVWMKYETDAIDPVDYTFQVDKTNAYATGVQYVVPLCRPHTSAHAGTVPKNIKKRYIVCFSYLNPKIRRKFYVGDLDTWHNIAAGDFRTIFAEDYPGADDAPGIKTEWVITYMHGERRQITPHFERPDTGLTN